MKVNEIMTKNVTVTEVPGTVEDVLSTFRESYHSGLPVIKKENKNVVGVITRSDLLNNPKEDQTAMIMTRDPISIKSDEEVKKAAKLILRNHIRRLPVVDNGKLKGIISVADLVDVLSEKTIDGEIEGYMEKSNTTAWEKTPVPIVGEIMRLADKDAIPVLDDEGELSGIISDTDLVEACEREDDLGKSDMGAASDEDQWTWDGMRDTMKFYYDVSKLTLPNFTVKEIMTTDVITTYLGSDVKEAAQAMSEYDIEQLPVLDESDKLVGMVKDRHLIKAFLK